MNNLRFAAWATLFVLAGCQQQAGQIPVTSPRGAATSSSVATGEGTASEWREARRGNRADTAAQAGEFDFYLLNLSWSPEFCLTHPDKSECASHAGLVLHGLWPQNDNGSYPEHCSDAKGPGDPGAFKDLYPDAGLLRHEWQTHGTCSGLTPDAFFTDARKAVSEVIVPPILRSVTQEVQMAPAEILGGFARANPGFPQGAFALSCGNNRLTAVQICLDKGLHAIACQGVRSCRANVVKVTPMGHD